jgi:DNA-binding MarR family transcriptional regulator
MRTSSENLETKRLLMTKVQQMQQSFDKISTTICKRYGLTVAQTMILQALTEGKFDHISNFAMQSGMNQGNLSLLCKELEKLGFVMRVRSTTDERKVNIVLTSAGRKKHRAVQKNLDAMIESAINNVDDQSVKAMVDGLTVMGELLNNMKGKLDNVTTK